MTETENKIINKWLSIEKNELFAKCRWEWKFAKVEMMMILFHQLKLPIIEANEMSKQLRPERESFYSLID